MYTINIHVNDYEKTNYSVISEEEWVKCVKNGQIDTVKLLETVHFNNSYPENHNIKIENANSKRVIVLKNSKFVEKGRGNRAIKEIIKETDIEVDNLPDDVQLAMDSYMPDEGKDNVDKVFKLMYNNNKLKEACNILL
jgi:hypothetical protein